MRLFMQPSSGQPAGAATDCTVQRAPFVPAQGSRLMLCATRTLRALAALLIIASGACFAHAQKKWTIAPTWLYRNTNTAPAEASDITTATCQYKPLLGVGDPHHPPRSILGSVARYGEAVVAPHGSCKSVQYAQEDQIYVVLHGNGSATYAGQDVPLKTEDYLYIPATVAHGLENTFAAPMTVVVMGFHTQGYPNSPLPAHPLKANIEDVPVVYVHGHPNSAHYRLLLGPINARPHHDHDYLFGGHVVNNLFLMQIDPRGTNFPHHHMQEEEVYLILSGHGNIVAGGGTDGVEGLHPANPGDLYFYRVNAEVGYFGAPGVHSQILAVQSWHPGMAPQSSPIPSH